MLHAMWWTIRHAEYLMALGVLATALAVVATDPGCTAADVTRQEVDGG